MKFCNLTIGNSKILKSMNEVTIAINNSMENNDRELTITNKEKAMFLIVPQGINILTYEQLTVEELEVEYNRILTTLKKDTVLALNVIPYEDKFKKPKLKDFFTEEIEMVENELNKFDFSKGLLPLSKLYKNLNQEYGFKWIKFNKEATIPQLMFYGKLKEKGFLSIEIKITSEIKQDEANYDKSIRFITKNPENLTEEYVNSPDFIEQIEHEFKTCYPTYVIKEIHYLNKKIEMNI